MKLFYQTAVILADGTNNGQKNGLTVNEFVQVDHMMRRLQDYEIKIDRKIRKDDIDRAIQENLFPTWFTT